MATLQQLLAEKARIDAEIQAQKPVAISQVFALMSELGVTLEDLGATPRTRAGGPKRPVKYRDEAGNTWTGVGQRPRWLRDRLMAGATLEQFSVRKT